MILPGTQFVGVIRAMSCRRPQIPFAAYLVIFCCLLGQLCPLGAVTINGEAYVSLPDVAKRFGMNHEWRVAQQQASITSKWTDMRFTLHQRDFVYNGKRIYLGSPVALHQRVLYISEVDYKSSLKPLLFPQQFEPKPKLYHIVLDPGHGGKDGGAQNKGLKLQEKNLTMDLALRVKSRLEKLGYKVTLTRTSDQYISLDDRSALANKVNADLFLSLHFNAIDSPTVDGIETFVITPAGHASTNTTKTDSRSYAGNQMEAWSMLAGYNIQAELTEKSGADDRGLKHARFAVLKDLKCPGVLVESGFVSHPTEGRNIGSAAYRDKLADGIVAGILAYQKALNRARGIDS